MSTKAAAPATAQSLFPRSSGPAPLGAHSPWRGGPRIDRFRETARAEPLPRVDRTTLLHGTIVNTMTLFEDPAQERSSSGARLVVALPRNCDFPKVLGEVIPMLRRSGGWIGLSARELSDGDRGALRAGVALQAHRFIDLSDGTSVVLALFNASKSAPVAEGWSRWCRAMPSVQPVSRPRSF